MRISHTFHCLRVFLRLKRRATSAPTANFTLQRSALVSVVWAAAAMDCAADGVACETRVDRSPARAVRH